MAESYYRIPQYLSPSSYGIWCENRHQFYQYYLSPRKLPRDPQTNYMAVGSAFDAYAKAFLHDTFVGDKDEKYAFENLFTAQVEEHNREQARIDGQRIFDVYKSSGALQDLHLKLNTVVGKPRFETEVRGIVEGHREGISKRVGAVPLLGKPDLYFSCPDDIRVIADWKVNGYYSKSGASPKPGFVREYPGFKVHKDCTIKEVGKIRINVARPMNEVDRTWAAQLAIYGWVLGEKVGGQFITMIHQIVCRPTGIRVAEHCAYIDKSFQHELYEGLQDAWYRIQEGLIFDDMTAEQSLTFAKSLDAAPPLTEEQLSLMNPAQHWRK